jgi:hypothetical protein
MKGESHKNVNFIKKQKKFQQKILQLFSRRKTLPTFGQTTTNDGRFKL